MEELPVMSLSTNPDNLVLSASRATIRVCSSFVVGSEFGLKGGDLSLLGVESRGNRRKHFTLFHQ